MIAKLLIPMLLLVSASGTLQAQTFNEWFFQNNTELKYLAKQIAALEAYEKAVAKGYAIIKTGTHIIGNIKRGDLSLHADYFNSLKAVNPAVRDLINTVQAEWLKDQIKKIRDETTSKASSSAVCTSNEVKAIHDTFEDIVTASAGIRSSLQAVLSNGQVEMTDAERITRSETLIRTLTEQYHAALTFSHAIESIIQNRNHDLFDVQTGKNLTGIK